MEIVEPEKKMAHLGMSVSGRSVPRAQEAMLEKETMCRVRVHGKMHQADLRVWASTNLKGVTDL